MPVFSVNGTVEFSAADIAALGDVLDPTKFPSCTSTYDTTTILDPDYVVIELHTDNNNLKATSQEFRVENKNDNDSVLGDDFLAPTKMRIASKLGQTTIVID